MTSLFNIVIQEFVTVTRTALLSKVSSIVVFACCLAFTGNTVALDKEQSEKEIGRLVSRYFEIPLIVDGLLNKGDVVSEVKEIEFKEKLKSIVKEIYGGSLLSRYMGWIDQVSVFSEEISLVMDRNRAIGNPKLIKIDSRDSVFVATYQISNFHSENAKNRFKDINTIVSELKVTNISQLEVTRIITNSEDPWMAELNIKGEYLITFTFSMENGDLKIIDIAQKILSSTIDISVE